MRTFIALVLTLGLPALGLAQGAAEPAQKPYGASAYATEPYFVATPDQIIRQGVNRLAGFLIGAKDASEDAVQEFVNLELAGYFDFAYMARWAAGPYFRRLDDAHKAAMTAKVRDMFLDALARNLGSLQRPLPRVDVFPARPGRSVNEASVSARVLDGNRQMGMKFRFYWSNDGWRVFDVSANGASAVAFYRRYFNNLFRRYGPDVALR